MCVERFHTAVTSDLDGGAILWRGLTCGGWGERAEVPPHSDIRLGWRSQFMKRADMMREGGAGSTPQWHLTWMEEPVCEAVWHDVGGEGAGSTPQRHQTWMEELAYKEVWHDVGSGGRGGRFHTTVTLDLDGAASLWEVWHDVGGRGGRFHTTVTLDLDGGASLWEVWHDVGGEGAGSTPQRHQAWMEEPVCEEVWHDVRGEGGGSTPQQH